MACGSKESGARARAGDHLGLSLRKGQNLLQAAQEAVVVFAWLSPQLPNWVRGAGSEWTSPGDHSVPPSDHGRQARMTCPYPLEVTGEFVSLGVLNP